ncbi:Nucleoside diphosphate kinase 7 [Cichlidogyrus casuarinus]|uniref:Nucleoside diphosphate kinase 7 n=1 Tax=Cichlidogyrus casuarinus TaxID=1844966 RepID=A0ABD2QLJ8_9PLAT
MTSAKDKKAFLRKTQIPELKLKDFFVGNTLNILGRLLKIVDYGNSTSEQYLARLTERVIIFAIRNGIQNIPVFIHQMETNGLRVINYKSSIIDNKIGKSFANCLDDLNFENLFGEFCLQGCEEIMFIEFIGEGASQSVIAKLNQNMKILCHTHITTEANKTSDTIFCGKIFKPIPRFEHSSLLLIKPHAIMSGSFGCILQTLDHHNINVLTAMSLRMTLKDAFDFMEVYKGVLPNFKETCFELAAGMSIALEVTCREYLPHLKTIDNYVDRQQRLDLSQCLPDYNPYNNPIFDDKMALEIHGKLREICGPMSPDIACKIRPNCLRAKFGEDDSKNAVYCTDLPDDIRTDLEYAFIVMNQ